jgi:hypothetical protein
VKQHADGKFFDDATLLLISVISGSPAVRPQSPSQISSSA